MTAGIFFSALCTLAGSVPALFLKNKAQKGQGYLLAYCAGIMIAASTHGLIPSALKLSNPFLLAAGIIGGVCLLIIMERFLPMNRSFRSLGTVRPELFMLAMMIRSIPEGFSTGVSYASGAGGLGPVVSFAIGLQNVPEGFLVTLFLITVQIKKQKAFILTSLIGIVELASSFFGMVLANDIKALIPWGLAFSAGAMLFIVYKDIIPESFLTGKEQAAAIFFIFGLLSMIGMTEILR